MNKIITLIMYVAFSATVSGQTLKVEDRVKTLEGDIKTLKGQLETQNCQIASMQSRLNELADRNAEYKKQFDIRQILTVTVDSVKYGIASAEGNAKTGNVVVTLMALNTERMLTQRFFMVHPLMIMTATYINALRIQCLLAD